MSDMFGGFFDKVGGAISDYTDGYIYDKFGFDSRSDAVPEGTAQVGGTVTDTGMPVKSDPVTQVAQPQPNMVMGFDLNNVNWGAVGAVAGVVGLIYTIAKSR